MSNVFLKVVNMSISASWLVLVVLVLRMILKKAPKWVNVLLWAIVAVRLICPVSLESAMSLVPSAETISTEITINSTPVIHSGVTLIDNTVNPFLDHSFMPEPNNSVNPLQILVSVLSTVWIVGIFALLAYAAISYWRLCRQVSTAVLVRDNVFRSEHVTYPFVLGILWPKVYLPVELKKPDINYVVAHEYAHIRRRDYWWKPFGFVLLMIHWFNPLMWMAYVLFCKDIELACDEKVVKRMKRDDKAAYAQALLNCSDPRRRKIACPLAFGENGVKQRVKTVLHYKRPAFLIIFSAVIICVVVAVCFLTNPASAKEQGEDSVASGIDGDGSSGTDGNGDQPDNLGVSGTLASEQGQKENAEEIGKAVSDEEGEDSVSYDEDSEDTDSANLSKEDVSGTKEDVTNDNTGLKTNLDTRPIYEITNGNTGERITLDDSQQLEYMDALLENMAIQKEESIQSDAEKTVGYLYCIRVLNEKGDVSKTITLKGNHIEIDGKYYIVESTENLVAYLDDLYKLNKLLFK